MLKNKKRSPARLIKLRCLKCEKIFKTKRYRKYCSDDCVKLVNNARSTMTYRKLRKALLREQGKLIE